jgi:hypothetical protein
MMIEAVVPQLDLRSLAQVPREEPEAIAVVPGQMGEATRHAGQDAPATLAGEDLEPVSETGGVGGEETSATVAVVLDPEMAKETAHDPVVGGATEFEGREGVVAVLGKGFVESLPQ